MTDVAVDLKIAWRSSHMRLRLMEVPPITTSVNGDSSDDKAAVDKDAVKEEAPVENKIAASSIAPTHQDAAPIRTKVKRQNLAGILQDT